ncbi:MAG: HEPN domain-containing protein [Saprospiraceae bacterium]|jgi:HEPN domain-containing protein
MTEKEVLNEIIISYRQLIAKRYDYAKVKQQYDIPDFFTEARMMLFKNYFLHHLYPPPQKRQELDEAFQNLDSYIKTPEKLLRILLDSGRLIFKYGRHLPKILQAGLKALKSFRAATQMEGKLVEGAQILSLKAPFSTEDIKMLLARLSPEDLDSFTANNEDLFRTLQDQKLVTKVIDIVEHIIEKMKGHPQLYSEVEVNALSIGRDIIQQGDLLFAKLTTTEQEAILKLTLQIEQDFLNGLKS